MEDFDAVASAQEEQLRGLRAALAARTSQRSAYSSSRKVSDSEDESSSDDEEHVATERDAKLEKMLDELEDEQGRASRLASLVDESTLSIEEVDDIEITREQLAEEVARSDTRLSILGELEAEALMRKEDVRIPDTPKPEVAVTTVEDPVLECGKARQAAIDRLQREQLELEAQRVPVSDPFTPKSALNYAQTCLESHSSKMQTLLAVREEVAHVTKVKHPLIPEECFIPYQPDNTSSRARPSKAALAVCAPILTGIINQALLKCFTVDEKMEVLRRRIDAFQEEEAVRAKVLEDEIRIAELDYSARRARQSMIDEVTYELSIAAIRSVASEVTTHAQQAATLITASLCSVFPDLEPQRSMIPIALELAFSKRKSITQYGNRFAAVHLISRSSQAGPVTRTKLVLRHTPGAHDLSALFPLPATVSSTGSSGRSAEVVVEQPVLNASPAWLAAFSAVVMPPASVPSSSISPTVATNPYEPHTRDTFLSDWHELCSWQCRQWAQLRVTPAHIDPNGSSTLLSRSGSRPGGVTSACSSRCGRFTIFGAVGGAVQLWQRLGDVQQWLLIQLCPPSPAAAVQALAVDPTLKSVLIRYSDGTVVLWKPEVLANESGSKSRDVLFTAMRKQRAIPVVTLPFDSCLRLCSPNPLSSSTEVVFVGIFGQADLLCRVHHAGIGTTDGTLTLHHLRPLSRTAGVPVEPDEYRKRMVALTGSSWLAACSPIDYVLPMEIRGIYAVRALGMKLGMGRRKKERLQKNLRRVMQAMPWLRTRLTEGSAATELPAIVSGSPDPSIEVAGTAIRATDPEGPTMTTDMVDVVELEVTEPAPTASKLSIAQRLAMETEAVIKLGEDLKQHYLSRVNQFGMGVPKLASVDESTFGAFTEAASSSSPPLVLHGHTAAVVHCGPCLGPRGPCMFSVDSTGVILFWDNVSPETATLEFQDPFYRVDLDLKVGALVRQGKDETVIFPPPGTTTPTAAQVSSATSRMNAFGPLSRHERVTRNGKAGTRKLFVPSSAFLDQDTLIELASQPSVLAVQLLQTVELADGTLERMALVPHLPTTRVGSVCYACAGASKREAIIATLYPAISGMPEMVVICQVCLDEPRLRRPVIKVEFATNSSESPQAQPSVCTTGRVHPQFQSELVLLLHKGRLQVFALNSGTLLNCTETGPLYFNRLEQKMMGLSASTSTNPTLVVYGPMMPAVAVYSMDFDKLAGITDPVQMESYQRVLKFLGCSESTVTNRSSSCWTTNMFSSASIARAIVYGIVDAVGEACCGSVLDRFIHVLDDRVEAASNPSE